MLELNELKGKTLVELREIAKEKGIPKYLGLRKAELIEKLFIEMSHEEQPPAELSSPAATPAPKRGRPRKIAPVPQPEFVPSDKIQGDSSISEKPKETNAEREATSSAKEVTEKGSPLGKPQVVRRGRPRKVVPVPQPEDVPPENKQEPSMQPETALPEKAEEPESISTPVSQLEESSTKDTQAPEEKTEQTDAETTDSLEEQSAVQTEEAFVFSAPSNSETESSAAPLENVQRPYDPEARRNIVRKRPEGVEEVDGILEVMADGYGFLRFENYMASDRDVYVSPIQIRRFNLKTGDRVLADVRPKDDENKFRPLLFVHKVNGDGPEVAMHRRPFDSLTPIYPDERMRLEVIDGSNDYATRLIDLIAPIGKGQRGIIVSPPKAGKTTLLKRIANSITTNYPESELIVLLVDERPEEVTDMKRSIHGDVVYSTFDEQPEHHAKVAELVLERAMRLAEHKRDVVILLDSLTRLTRAYNLIIPPSGRTLTGGIDPAALYKPKRFFGAARNIEEGGSITILATALVETGSRMDDVIFEEFKGTGNMELKLDRALQEKRVFPAIDIKRSGTRREESLLTEDELNAVWAIRKLINTTNSQTITEELIHMLVKTPNNERLVNQILAVYSKK
jgi:transcription termination factor Rho